MLLWLRLTATTAPGFPGTLANARYVYVASYDGDQFNPNLLPEDREAIGSVQNAIQNWGKLTLVYEPSQADIIILVTSRPSEDVLAVYDARGSKGNYLWRVMGRVVWSRVKPRWSPSLKKLLKASKSTSNQQARAVRQQESRPHLLPGFIYCFAQHSATVARDLWFFLCGDHLNLVCGKAKEFEAAGS